jgi:hypothetical protein
MAIYMLHWWSLDLLGKNFAMGYEEIDKRMISKNMVLKKHNQLICHRSSAHKSKNLCLAWKFQARYVVVEVVGHQRHGVPRCITKARIYVWHRSLFLVLAILGRMNAAHSPRQGGTMWDAKSAS